LLGFFRAELFFFSFINNKKIILFDNKKKKTYFDHPKSTQIPNSQFCLLHSSYAVEEHAKSTQIPNSLNRNQITNRNSVSLPNAHSVPKSHEPQPPDKLLIMITR